MIPKKSYLICPLTAFHKKWEFIIIYMFIVNLAQGHLAKRHLASAFLQAISCKEAFWQRSILAKRHFCKCAFLQIGNFARSNFARIHFTRRNFARIHFARRNFARIHFAGAILQGSILQGAILQGSISQGSIL